MLSSGKTGLSVLVALNVKDWYQDILNARQHSTKHRTKTAVGQVQADEAYTGYNVPI
jgi:hypothetical protein